MSPESSISSVGVPMRSVTRAKKRRSISCCRSSAVRTRSVWARGDMAAVVPGEGDRVQMVRLVGGLFAQGQAVPGEPDLFDHALAVGRQTLFRGASAQRVVAVPPAVPVGGGHGGEAVLRVPCVAPGIGLAGETGLLSQDHPAESVVFEADISGPGDGGAGVGAWSGGFMAGVMHPCGTYPPVRAGSRTWPHARTDGDERPGFLNECRSTGRCARCPAGTAHPGRPSSAAPRSGPRSRPV